MQTLNTLKRPNDFEKMLAVPKEEGKKLSQPQEVRYSRDFLTNFSFARARLKNAFSPATRGLIHLETPLTH